MTDRRGNTQHFDGIFLNISGEDQALNDMLDDLQYVSCAEIMDRQDTKDNQGIITIRTKKHTRQRIIEIAKKHKLSVGD